MGRMIDLPIKHRARGPVPDKDLEGRVIPGPKFLATSICAYDPRCDGDGEKPCRLHFTAARHALHLCQTPEQAAISCQHGWACPICKDESGEP